MHRPPNSSNHGRSNKKQMEAVLASHCKLLEPPVGDDKEGNWHRMPLMPRAPPRQTTARAAQARVAVAMCGVLIAATALGARLRQPHLPPRLRHHALGKVMLEDLHTQPPAR